jgi:hypothetical protein
VASERRWTPSEKQGFGSTAARLKTREGASGEGRYAKKHSFLDFTLQVLFLRK